MSADTTDQARVKKTLDTPPPSVIKVDPTTTALIVVDIKTIVLTGVVTYACVLTTAFSAFDRGFDVVVISDAVGTLWDHLGNAALEMIDLLVGHAITSEQLVMEAAG